MLTAALHGAAAALRPLLDIALPRACAACGALLGATEPGVVCGRCWALLEPLPAPRCSRCGHPRARPSEVEHCRWCESLPPYVRAARSVCWMSAGSAGRLVYALKYEGWTGVAGGMSERMARLDWPDDVLEERTALVPVPLAAARLRMRGFNQSERLARELAARWHIEVWDACLERTRATRSQTRLSPEERRTNVSGAFRARAASSPGRLRGAHLVLVDDVLTTGATLNACAAALVLAGARILSYVTFARARALGD